MLDFWPVYKRELKAYFQTPSTYVVLALFFLIVGTIFYDVLLGFSEISRQAQFGAAWQATEVPEVTEIIVSQIFALMTSLMMFLMPILTMRLLAEEKNRGTFEVLVTSPIGDWSILIGKYLALLTVLLLVIAISGLYPLITWWVGRSTNAAPQWSVVLSCAIGLVMIFATYGAFGLMASSFTDNQMTAGVITLVGLIFLQIIGAFQFLDSPVLRDIVRELSAYSHGENIIKGIIHVKDVAYYLLISFLFLFIASKTLDARRWRI